MTKRTGEFRNGEVFSVRVDTETAKELRWAAKEDGTSASELFRRGLRPLLATLRAYWYEEHGTDEDWEVVPGSGVAGPSRKLDSVFGVRLSGEQVRDVLAAAEACGVTISAYLREAGLALAAAQQAGGTARCQHVSIGHITSAECGICGPLPVTYQVPA